MSYAAIYPGVIVHAVIAVQALITPGYTAAVYISILIIN